MEEQLPPRGERATPVHTETPQGPRTPTNREQKAETEEEK